MGRAVEGVLPAKNSAKGLRHGETVEAFTLLTALGGDCVDDFAHLRRDEGLRAILGYELPAPPTARQWQDKAHEEQLILAAREASAQMGMFSYIPAESARLRGLKEGIIGAVHASAKAVKPAQEVTLDVDAHLVESTKQSALPTHDGYRGFHRIIVSWAEANLILQDEFRDGNVPAQKGIAGVVDESY